MGKSGWEWKREHLVRVQSSHRDQPIDRIHGIHLKLRRPREHRVGHG